MIRKVSTFAMAVVLAGCQVTTTSGPVRTTPDSAAAAPRSTSAVSAVPASAGSAFARVVRTVEPVAERECRARTQRVNCDFLIVVIEQPNAPANAFQTIDKSGRPVIAFTLALIEDARNRDELAFVMGHEAAHHIRGHIPRQQQNAAAGAVVATGLAVLLGGDPTAVQEARRTGAAVGARSFSKDFELEADALGTVIAARAGYDPVRGAKFFSRIPDPGDRFLGTHPPNAQRIDIVRRTAAGL
ncbi:M48 family metallopeptidase [Roseobacter sp. S98]|uniref:M48 family metallopeptidase n=1 Tax=Roseobacter algicola (ex Choi et al. 2025) (nom. illeg.) TaxID=3092138 RepID=UPI0035C6725A